MKESLAGLLLRRELDDPIGRTTKIRHIYGNKNWVRNLDIVNELDGHSGCVNALRYLSTACDAHLLSLLTSVPVGPSQVVYSLLDPMINISTSTLTSLTTPPLNLLSAPPSPQDTLQTSSLSSSCHIPTTELSSLPRETTRYASLTLSIPHLLSNHLLLLHSPLKVCEPSGTCITALVT